MSAAIDREHEAVVAARQADVLRELVEEADQAGDDRLALTLTLETWETIRRAMEHYSAAMAGGVEIRTLERRILDRMEARWKAVDEARAGRARGAA